MGNEQYEKIGFDAVIYGLYAALIPLNMIMNFTGSTINKQIGVVAAGFMLVVLATKNKLRYITISNRALLFFLMYSVGSIIWSINYSVSKSAIITLVSLVLIYKVGIMRSFNEKELNLIITLMLLASMIIPFYLGINYGVSYSRLTLSNANGSADQNGLACNMSFVAVLAFNAFFISKNRILKLFYAFGTALVFIGIILTGSRAAVLGLLIALLYYLIRMVPDLKRSKSFWGSILIIVIGGVIIWKYLGNNLSTSIINRFTVAGIVSDGGSGRLSIWNNIGHILSDNPVRALIGYGFGTQKEIYTKYYGVTQASHNVFLQLLLDIGIIGTSAFVIAFIRFWKDARNNRCFVSNALWIVLLCTFLTLTFTTNKGAWNTLLLMYIFTYNQANLISREADNDL